MAYITLCISHHWLLMPFGGGHTVTRTHTNVQTKAISRNQMCHRPTYAWFNKETNNYVAKKLLVTHSVGSIGYYLCLIIQAQFQLGNYTIMQAQMKHIL